MGAQRADVGSTRAIWAVQDKLALDADEEKAIELKREVVAGQERAAWNPALSPTDGVRPHGRRNRAHQNRAGNLGRLRRQRRSPVARTLARCALRPVDGLDTSPPKSLHGG